jgi:LysR family transcriptional regulator AphB
MIYNDIALFVAVAKAGRFSGAAKDLGLSLSMVSRRILDFEAAIGVKLFERNTRNVRLTHEGRSLLDRTEALIEGLNSAVRARFAGDGTIRATAPPLAARTQLGSRLLDFLSRNPEIKLDLVATNSQLDLIEDNIDIAFRLGPLNDSSLVAVKLWDVPYAVCGSPALAEEYGIRSGVETETLAGLPCIYTGQPWRFEGVPHLKLRNVVHRIDELELAAEAVSRGLGFGFLPLEIARTVGRVIKVGRLKPVSRTLYALYPSRRLLPTHLRNLIEYIRTPQEQTPGIARRTQVQGRVSLDAPKSSKVGKKLG